jgi:endonuclease
MAIYAQPVRLLMHQMVRDTAIKPGQLITRENVLDWFKTHYPLVKEATVTAHLMRMSTNARSRVHHKLVADGSDDLLYQVDRSRYRLYDPATDPPPIRVAEDNEERLEEPGLNEEPSPDSEFAYEHDLRDFLARNLHLIEPGLTLYSEEGVTGIEFPVGGRWIDILAVDRSRAYVVIELKVSKGYDRTIGQLLRYMGWIEKHHAEEGQSVRGVIIAKTISDDLKLACNRISGIQLFEYSLSVDLKPVIL